MRGVGGSASQSRRTRANSTCMGGGPGSGVWQTPWTRPCRTRSSDDGTRPTKRRLASPTARCGVLAACPNGRPRSTTQARASRWAPPVAGFTSYPWGPWARTRSRRTGTSRRSPVIAASEQKPPHDGAEIVYAAGREGWVFPRYLNGSLIAGWDRGDFLIPPVGGLPTGGTFVGRTNQDHQVISPDAGRFAQPAVAGSNVFLASTTGCIYTLRVVGTGGDAANGSVQWFFCEELRDVGFAPEFRAAPLTLETNAAIMFGAAIKKSPENTTQTNGVFYSLRMDTGANM